MPSRGQRNVRRSAMDSLRSLVPRATASLRGQLVNGDGKLALGFLYREKPPRPWPPWPNSHTIRCSRGAS